MIRPWQIWCSFALCLFVAFPAMAWLTVKTIQLERAEVRARSEAEQEQKIGLALWRMDTALTPILAHESAHPFSIYRPFLESNASLKSNGSKASSVIPSPLLKEPSKFVRLHFQIDAQGTWSSPQTVDLSQSSSVARYGWTAERLRDNQMLLAQLSQDCADVDLLSRLPEDTLDQFASLSLDDPTDQAAREFLITNSPAYDAVGPQAQAEGAAPQAAEPQQRGQVPDQQQAYQFDARNRVFRNFGQQAVRQQRSIDAFNNSAGAHVVEGVSRPMWVGNHLLFARRASSPQGTLVQGSCLDWPRLKDMLLSECGDELPHVDLVPVRSGETQLQGRMLATLPVALTMPPLEIQSNGWNPISISLAAAWLCLILTSCAIGILIMGLIRLSERRAAFVSAVTHELRTPLTTFRMYSEMLAQGIVTDPEQRKRYLQTLTVEADRLAHLVENVLAFARLERGPVRAHRETLTVSDMIERCEGRLQDRAEAAQMSIQWETDVAAESTLIATNTAAVEQILFNLIENACKYASRAAERVIRIETRILDRDLVIRVADRGPGIPPDIAKRLFQPFHKSSEQAARTAPGVGLGLALCRRLARNLGGDLCLDKSVPNGACFVLRLPLLPSTNRWQSK